MADGGNPHHRRNGVGVRVIRVRFAGCLGLNTQVSPLGLAYDGQTQMWEAARLVNADVLDGGRRTRRRPGWDKVEDGHWRDPFEAADGTAYAVVDDVLCRIAWDRSRQAIVSLATSGRVVWTELDGTVFWTNGNEKGLIQNGVAEQWGGRTWDVASEADRFTDPPAGQALGAYAGRIWIGVGRDLRYTEGYGGYHFVKAGLNAFRFPAEITAIRGVDDGLYVSTTTGTFLMTGPDPLQMQRRQVAPDGVISGSDLSVRADDWGKFDPQNAVLCTTPRGISLAIGQGLFVNFTKNKIALDAPATVAAAIALPRRYVVALHP